jgi:hypothetical protein
MRAFLFRVELANVTARARPARYSGDCFLEIVRAQALKDDPRQQQNCTDRYEEKARPVRSEP